MSKTGETRFIKEYYLKIVFGLTVNLHNNKIMAEFFNYSTLDARYKKSSTRKSAAPVMFDVLEIMSKSVITNKMMIQSVVTWYHSSW